MAINAGNVYSELILNTKNYEAGIRRAERQAEGLAGKLKSVGNKMTSAGRVYSLPIRN